MNFIRQSIRFFCAASALSYALYFGSQSSAGPIVGNSIPSVTLQIENVPAPTSWSYRPSANDFRPATDEDGGFELNGTRDFDVLANRAHVRIEELQFDPDPFVLNNILVTNTTNATQIFSAFVGLPTTFPAPNVISGSVRTSVIDGGTDGATVATVGPNPIYAAQIDGTTVATLQNHPFSLTAPSPGPPASAVASFGPTPNNIPVTSNIGILLRFSLTPGDTAAILSRFDVVPEPTYAALIGIGLVTCIGSRLRRR
jgi:hypothetical protein